MEFRSLHPQNGLWVYAYGSYRVQINQKRDGYSWGVYLRPFDELLDEGWVWWVQWGNYSELRREEIVGKFVRQAIEKGTGFATSKFPADKEFQKAYPALWEYLTATEYDKDKPRETATLSVFVDGGKWKSVINDRDNQRSGFTTSDTFNGVITETDARLQTDSMDWRPWSKKGPARGK